MALDPERSYLRSLCFEYFSICVCNNGGLWLLWLWLETTFLASWRKDLYLDLFLQWLLHGFRLLRRPVWCCLSLAGRLQGEVWEGPARVCVPGKIPPMCTHGKKKGKKTQTRICRVPFEICPRTFLAIGPQYLALAGTKALLLSPLLFCFRGFGTVCTAVDTATGEEVSVRQRRSFCGSRVPSPLL